MGRIRSFAKQLAQTLNLLKMKRIIYGNLRPSKVLIKSKNDLEICITDFTNVIEESETRQGSDFSFSQLSQLYEHIV